MEGEKFKNLLQMEQSKKLSISAIWNKKLTTAHKGHGIE